MDWMIGVAGVLVPMLGVSVLLAAFFRGLAQSERELPPRTPVQETMPSDQSDAPHRLG